MKGGIFILILLGYCCGCKNGCNNKPGTVALASKNSVAPKPVMALDSLKFYKVAKSLESIRFFMSGQDSFVAGKYDRDKLPELGFAKENFPGEMIGQPDMATPPGPDYFARCKLRCIDGKEGARPKAAVIQLAFGSNEKALAWLKWEAQGKNNVTMIKGIKPKTWMWLDASNVYLVQTYYTPAYDYVNLLRDSLMSNLKR